MYNIGLMQSFTYRGVTARRGFALLLALFLWLPGASVASAQSVSCPGNITADSSLTMDPADLQMINVSASGGSLTLSSGFESGGVSPFDRSTTLGYLGRGDWVYSDASSLLATGYTVGWVIRSVVEQEVPRINGSWGATSPLAFQDLVDAHTAYKARTGHDLIHISIPYTLDTDKDGIFDALYDPASWTFDGFGMTFTQTVASEPSEAELTANGMAPDNDGVSDYKDSRRDLGVIGKDVEIIYFFLFNNSPGSYKRVYYSDANWNWNTTGFAPGTATSADRTECQADVGSAFDTINGDTIGDVVNNIPNTVNMQFDLSKIAFGYTGANGCSDIHYENSGAPLWRQGIFTDKVMTRVKALYGATPSDRVAFGTLTQNKNYNHFASLSVTSDVNRVMFGLDEDDGSSGNWNGFFFTSDTRAGGSVTLTNPLAASSGSITSGFIAVTDTMPCSGNSQIRYFLSPDNGANWVEIKKWQTVRSGDASGSLLPGWTFGSVATTYRSATVNFTAEGMSGSQLIWRADLAANDSSCAPTISDVQLTSIAAAGTLSHSSPTVLGNVVYSASYGVGGGGSLTSKEIYDPTNPTGYTNSQNWEAGSILTAAGVGSRNVYTPAQTITQTVAESLAAAPDGALVAFSGTLAAVTRSNPLIYSTLAISDGNETFTDTGRNILVGDRGGSGTVDRYTGAYSLSFARAPLAGVPITASYSTYKISGGWASVAPGGSITADMLALNGGLTYVNVNAAASIPVTQAESYNYDMDGNGSYDPAGDRDWLVNWILGYADGVATKKSNLLGATDHSTPALSAAPGIDGWYYGTDVTDAERDSYDAWRCSSNAYKRDTIALIGARDGMLHGFNAGSFRPYYVNETTLASCAASDFRAAINTCKSGGSASIPYYPGADNICGDGNDIKISRGYYDRPGGSSNYGTGAEEFAVIPASQLARFKNLALGREDRQSVDGSPTVATILSGGTYKTIAVVASGSGGDSIMAIDITTPSTPLFLWEFGDTSLYGSTASPSVVRLGSTWAVVVPSGLAVDDATPAKVFAIDATTGALLGTTSLAGGGGDDGGATVAGAAAAVDSDGNGTVDRAYIGTDKGVVYKLTFNSSGVSDVCTFASVGQPIYASPAVNVSTSLDAGSATVFNIDVLFGTGSNPYHLDSADGASTYTFYAYRDTDSVGGCSSGDLRWSKALPAGQGVFASASVAAGQVYFGTSSGDSEDPCAPNTGGSSDPQDGTSYAITIEDGVVVMEESTGPVTTSPVVDDEHVYTKKGTGEIEVRGNNNFQNELDQKGNSDVIQSSWRELKM